MFDWVENTLLAYEKTWTDFASCFSVFVVDFKQVVI